MSYYDRSQRCIGQGALTNSKNPRSHVFGVYPTHIKNSTGCYLIDTNGKKYMDFICGLGTNLLGYGHPLVEQEVAKYAMQGKSPSLPHILEVETAEALKPMFPWVEKWKFLKTGSEACSAALRMARVYAGSLGYNSDGYHGWHDNFLSLKLPHNGVHHYPDLSMGSREDPIMTAGWIVEAVELDRSQERMEYLRGLPKPLILDEVITGFRFLNHSVSKAHDLRPDLIVIGKAMANGYPLAAVGGRAEIMDSDYFVSSTYAGELSSLAACKAVCNILKTNPQFDIKHLWEAGEQFIEEFNSFAHPLAFQIDGYPTRGVFKGNDLNIALFFQEACKAGFIFGKSWFISFSHLPLMKQTILTLRDILEKMSQRLPELEGKMPETPISMRFRK